MHKLLTGLILGCFISIPAFAGSNIKITCTNSDVDSYIREQLEKIDQLDSFPGIADYHWKIAYGCDNASFAARHEFLFNSKNLETTRSTAQSIHHLACGKSVSKPVTINMSVSETDVRFEGDLSITIDRKTLDGYVTGKEEYKVKCEMAIQK